MEAVEVNKLTLEEALNYACSKIVEQGQRCTEDDYCMYGDDEGNHCAVGWLLDDSDEELMGFEGPLFELIHDHKDKVPSIVRRNLEIFKQLQGFHDTSHGKFREEALENLRDLTCLRLDEPHWEQWVDMGDDEYEP